MATSHSIAQPPGTGTLPGIWRDRIEAPDDLVQYVLSLNLHRRHLTTSQRAMVAARVKEHYAAEAKERQKRKPKSVVEKLPQQTTGKSRDKAGEPLGVSGKSVDAASKVLAKGNKTLQDAVDAGAIPVSTAGEDAPTKQGERTDIGNLPKLPQGQRAKQNGISPRTQRKLDRLAREHPKLHERVSRGERKLE